jgi:hypothetical protein
MLTAGFFASGSICLTAGFAAEVSAEEGEVSATSMAVNRLTV